MKCDVDFLSTLWFHIVNMMKFPIPPEYCLVVNAFNQTSSLRGAAAVLGTDPASLVRKAQKISSEFSLLHKVGNRWAVTETGRRVAQWTDDVIQSQLKLLDEKPSFRIAAFGWLAEEMMIPHFQRLDALFNTRYSWSYKIIASDLEQELLQSRSDFVITGHAPNDPSIAHRRLGTYPWVVVVPYSWKKAISNLAAGELYDFLRSRPFLRYTKVNPEQILKFSPENISNLMMDGVIGVRAGVAAEIGWGVIPAMAGKSLLKEKKVIKLDLHTHIKDEISIWWLRSRKDTTASIKTISLWISEFEV